MNPSKRSARLGNAGHGAFGRASVGSDTWRGTSSTLRWFSGGATGTKDQAMAGLTVPETHLRCVLLP